LATDRSCVASDETRASSAIVTRSSFDPLEAFKAPLEALGYA
jgi:hypothetical protein